MNFYLFVIMFCCFAIYLVGVKCFFFTKLCGERLNVLLSTLI